MPEIDRFQGEVTQSLENIKDTQTLIRDEFTHYRKENSDQHRQLFEKLETTNLGMLTTKNKIDTHVGEDNRRFGLVWKSLFAIAGIVGAAVLIAKALP